MKIYSDKTLNNEIKVLDLGIVEAGESETFTFYVYNDSSAELRDLFFVVDHKEVEVKSSPKTMPSLSSDELIIEWKPSITLKEGLKTPIQIKGKEIWG